MEATNKRISFNRIYFSIKSVILPAAFLMFLVCNPFRLLSQDDDFFVIDERKIIATVFDSEVIKMMNEVGVPGLSFAVIADNKVVYSKAYGYKSLKDNKIALDEKTVFEAASLSKPYLSFVVLKLIDEGKFDIDKPIYQYMENSNLMYDERYKLITSRMILNHSSGLENWEFDNNPDTLEILADPGTKYTYSGTGYNYLGEVIGMVINQSYEEYITKRILNPLKLKNTYLKYEKVDSLSNQLWSPSNYAIGYSTFLNKDYKWYNEEPVPSSSINVNAEDYAKFIISFFENGNISNKTMADMLTPAVKIKGNKTIVYSGLAFEINITDNDTIIAHSGSNPGFRPDLFYSVKSGNGLVIFTNYERGDIMTEKLNELTIGLNLSTYLEDEFFEQYPSTAISLLSVFREKGESAMLSEIDKLKDEGKLKVNALNEVADELLVFDKNLTIKILKENLKLYPKSATAYFYLGRAYIEICEFDKAKACFEKAKKMNFDIWDVEEYLEECDRLIEHNKTRQHSLFELKRTNSTKIESEDYSAMCGVGTEKLAPNIDGENVTYIDTGDWMSYNLNIPISGKYTMDIKVASISQRGKITVLLGSKVLAKIDVPLTGGWMTWTTITTDINLPAGNRNIKLVFDNGDFDMDWMKIQRKK